MATQKYKLHVKTDTGYVDIDVLHAINSDLAANAGHASSADLATNATHATNATNADYATNAGYSNSTNYADHANYAPNANHANGADYASSAARLGAPRFKLIKTLVQHNLYTITHNLGTEDPIVMFAGTLGNFGIQWNTYGPNAIQVMNYNDCPNDWYGVISIW